MKHIQILLVSLLLMAVASGIASAQVVRVFTTKAIATATNRTDTSSTISTKYLPYVEIGTSVTGTDSSRIYVTVDYLVAGKWVIGGKLDTLKFGGSIGNTSKAKGTIVLAPYVASAIPGATDFRIRNTMVPFRSQDSTSATSYTQVVILRKSN
jgi:hypothetical protein